MNGLEAIELMKQGKLVVSTDEVGETYVFKILNNNVCFKDIKDSDDEYQSDFAFDFSVTYEEYIEPKPLIGWERVDKTQTYYYINGFNALNDTIEANYEVDKTTYEKANYFSTEEKAEEINSKQTLFRKLQRFSDENGGNGIDWKNEKQAKFFIRYNHSGDMFHIDYYWRLQEFGIVYFISKEIAEKAIELFYDELIKYFTGDFGGNK